MNAIILSAGLGTRLKPITDVIPKPLLPIVDRPIIEINIQRLTSFGVEKIGINLFHRADLVKNFLNELPYDLLIAVENKLKGTGGALLNFKSFIKGDLVIHNCDVISNINLRRAINFHKQYKPVATLIMTKNEGTNFVKVNRKYEIEEFSKKENKDYYTYTGIAILSERLMPYLPKRNCFSIVEVFQRIINDGKLIMGLPTKQPWYDIGTAHTYWQVHHDILGKKVKFNEVSADSHFYIHHSSIVRTKNLFGFVSIGPSCSIAEKVRLKNTIIFENSKIIQGDFENCLLSDKFCIKLK